MFLAETIAEPEQLEAVEEVLAAGVQMKRLIDDLLDITKIEAGNMTLQRGLVDVTALAKRLARNHSRFAAPKQIELVLEVQGDLNAQWDGARVQQALDNLMSNAIKFSQPNKRVWLTAKRDGESVLIWIRDEGQGIPKGELQLLFKPFSRTSVNSTAGESSTGLGLAIVDKIVKAHGGQVSVESTPGLGTVFTVKLPRTSLPTARFKEDTVQ